LVFGVGGGFGVLEQGSRKRVPQRIEESLGRYVEKGGKLRPGQQGVKKPFAQRPGKNRRGVLIINYEGGGGVLEGEKRKEGSKMAFSGILAIVYCKKRYITVKVCD